MNSVPSNMGNIIKFVILSGQHPIIMIIMLNVLRNYFPLIVVLTKWSFFENHQHISYGAKDKRYVMNTHSIECPGAAR